MAGMLILLGLVAFTVVFFIYSVCNRGNVSNMDELLKKERIERYKKEINAPLTRTID